MTYREPYWVNVWEDRAGHQYASPKKWPNRHHADLVAHPDVKPDHIHRVACIRVMPKEPRHDHA